MSHTGVVRLCSWYMINRSHNTVLDPLHDLHGGQQVHKEVQCFDGKNSAACSAIFPIKSDRIISRGSEQSLQYRWKHSPRCNISCIYNISAICRSVVSILGTTVLSQVQLKYTHTHLSYMSTPCTSVPQNYFDGYISVWNKCIKLTYIHATFL